MLGRDIFGRPFKMALCINGRSERRIAWGRLIDSRALLSLNNAIANLSIQCPLLATDISHRFDRIGEGFGMPLGVAKPPMQEPAARMLCAMGFAVLVQLGGCQ